MATFCSKCGAEISTMESFCPKCGAMISMGSGATKTNSNNQNDNTVTVTDNGPQNQSIFGIISMVLGIVGLCLFCVWFIGLPLGIAALVLGLIGVKKGGEYKTGMAVAGIIMGSLALVISAAMLIFDVKKNAIEEAYNQGYNPKMAILLKPCHICDILYKQNK
ncbi:MAG: zinc-ribbon domain-containing protein [Lachnospiraceae bacterium]|nr:zinc-ribbon domain-containing protein [Lachnospiraceae bacterium]